MCELIEAEEHIYPSVNWVIIGSDNSLLPVWHQAIICTNDGLSLIGPHGTNCSQIISKYIIILQENEYEKIICKTATILFWLQCVKSRGHYEEPLYCFSPTL